MLVPGEKGLSENIEVISIIGRYLEHSRIYYFNNSGNGNEEIFLASADLMSRNLEKRIEIMFPLISSEHKERVKSILEKYFEDNVQSHRLRKYGTYEKLTEKDEKINAQLSFHHDAQIFQREKQEFKVLKNQSL